MYNLKNDYEQSFAVLIAENFSHTSDIRSPHFT